MGDTCGVVRWLVCVTALFVAGCGGAASPSAPESLRVIRIDGSFAVMTPTDIATDSELVIRASSMGHRQEHWNNAANSEWGTDEDGAYIYRDELLLIEEVLAGSFDSETISVRTVGGTVDGVRMQFEGNPN